MTASSTTEPASREPDGAASGADGRPQQLQPLGAKPWGGDCGGRWSENGHGYLAIRRRGLASRAITSVTMFMKT